jgi:hypothetical protein
MSDHHAIVASISAGAPIRAIVPTDFDQVTRFAKMAVMAGMFKESKDADENKAIAQATMAVLQGMECGIPPMQAVQQIAVINGRCTIWGDLIPALVWRAGHKIKEWLEGDGDQRVAWCEITRGDNGEIVKRSFSVKQAIKAGLWGKDIWKKYDDRMLQMRARGFCARDAVPDVLRGLYMREELEHEQRCNQSRDVTPPKAPEPELIPPPAPPVEDEVEPAAEASRDGIAPELDVIADLAISLEAAKLQEEIDEIWGERDALICALPMADRSRAQDLYEKHVARVHGGGNA